jgi:hypothetical protein
MLALAVRGWLGQGAGSGKHGAHGGCGVDVGENEQVLTGLQICWMHCRMAGVYELESGYVMIFLAIFLPCRLPDA